VAKVELHSH